MQCQSLIAFVAVHIVRCTQLTPCQEAFGSEVSNDLVIKLPPNIVGASSSKDMVKRMQPAEFHFQVYRQKARSCFKFTAKSALVSCIDHAHSVACIINEGPDLPLDPNFLHLLLLLLLCHGFSRRLLTYRS